MKTVISLHIEYMLIGSYSFSSPHNLKYCTILEKKCISPFDNVVAVVGLETTTPFATTPFPLGNFCPNNS